jgi:raffinose/stachyose/melibiose transport system permease protein
MSKKKWLRLKDRISKGIMLTILIGWALTTIYPMFWVVMNAFKTSNEIIDNAFALPKSLNLENYYRAIEEHVLSGYMNSLIISGSVVVFTIIIASLASYVIARFQFKSKIIINALVMGSLLIPVFATILPVFEMLLKGGLVDNHLGLILPQIAGNLPFAIMVLSSFMETIPVEMEEAAVVEGASTFQIFTRIIAPLTKPAIATTAIFAFLWSYNDLFSSLIIMRSKDKMPINVLLTEISSQYGTNYGLMAAVIVIIIIPVLVFYMFAQNQIVEGMTAGAVKG